MDVSVIIVNYNVKEFLRVALASVERAFEFGKLEGEIFVVDNNSEDDSVEMVRKEFPNVKLHALKENLGFGRANNLAMREATGEYLLLLNPDTIVGEDTLRHMVEFMKAHPEAGLSGCKLLNADGSFQEVCRRGFPTPWASFTKLFGLSKLFPHSRLFAQYHLSYLPVDEIYEVDAISGAFMFLSREAWLRTSGFDESYFMYAEDLDLCFRVKKSGLNVFYVPTTATVHFKGESTKRSSINEVKVFYDAMHIFVKKNYGSSTIFSLLLRLGIFLRTMLAHLKKHQGAVLLALLDALAAGAAVFCTNKFVMKRWFGLPPEDYPFAILVPMIVVPMVLAMLHAYSFEDRRKTRPIIVGVPAMLIILSSLTYFFKDFASSRSLVLANAAMEIILLSMVRLLMGVVDRIRFGGDRSASPVLRNTVIIGTDAEAIRIGMLLKRKQFLKRYNLIGFIDNSLNQLGEKLLGDVPIVGNISMLSRIVRDQKISEVIFTSSALPYTEMLSTMQSVADQSISRHVNFNVVPQASDVLVGRRKIEILDDTAGQPIALMPMQYNIQRISHRVAKRSFDLVSSAAVLPWLSVAQMISPREKRSELIAQCKRIMRGELSWVGMAMSTGRSASLSKGGYTSLAAITLDAPDGRLQDARMQDAEQIDLYYAKNHTLGMDVEILLRSMLRERTTP